MTLKDSSPVDQNVTPLFQTSDALRKIINKILNIDILNIKYRYNNTGEPGNGIIFKNVTKSKGHYLHNFSTDLHGY